MHNQARTRLHRPWAGIQESGSRILSAALFETASAAEFPLPPAFALWSRRCIRCSAFRALVRADDDTLDTRFAGTGLVPPPRRRGFFRLFDRHVDGYSVRLSHYGLFGDPLSFFERGYRCFWFARLAARRDIPKSLVANAFSRLVSAAVTMPAALFMRSSKHRLIGGKVKLHVRLIIAHRRGVRLRIIATLGLAGDAIVVIGITVAPAASTAASTAAAPSAAFED